MNVDAFVAGFVASLRERAALIRDYGSEECARACERVAGDLEAEFHNWWRTELTVAEAALECWYTPDHLRELVRKGELQHSRVAGSRDEIRIRRCDLTVRRTKCASDISIDQLANEILNDRK
jgi:hypothetical protein